nr:hypothetical protein CFP56_70609 [Quercus suber]
MRSGSVQNCRWCGRKTISGALGEIQASQPSRNKAEISRLTLNQKEERHVEQLPTVIGSSLMVIRDPDIGFLAEIGAPAGVVPEELPPELAQNDGVDVV